MGIFEIFQSEEKPQEAPQLSELQEDVQKDMPFPDEKPSAWGGSDNETWADEKGELLDEKLAGGYKEIPEGGEIMYDAGVYFYKVQPGDGLIKIANKLADFHPEFEYLRGAGTTENKNISFNIPNSALRPGEWIPVPMKARQLTDKQFANHCFHAIKMMEIHPQYGDQVKDLAQKVGEKELIATMIATAKQESGGKPLGSFVFHRFEPHHKAFSYSILHILDKDDGLKARQNLKLSRGQMYHPENAAKVFLAFLFEKTNNPARLFPLNKNLESFVSFYNGAEWKNYNPNYAKFLESYYLNAIDMFEGRESLKKAEPFYLTVGNLSPAKAIQEANTLNTRRYPNKKLSSMLVLDENIELAARILKERVKATYHSAVLPTDEIALWINDEGRTYLKHKRSENEIDIRIEPEIYPLQN